MNPSTNKEGVPWRTLAELERGIILQRLAAYRGNRVATAASLGISRTTLWRRLQEYGVLAESAKK